MSGAYPASSLSALGHPVMISLGEQRTALVRCSSFLELEIQASDSHKIANVFEHQFSLCTMEPYQN